MRLYKFLNEGSEPIRALVLDPNVKYTNKYLNKIYSHAAKHLSEYSTKNFLINELKSIINIDTLYLVNFDDSGKATVIETINKKDGSWIDIDWANIKDEDVQILLYIIVNKSNKSSIENLIYKKFENEFKKYENRFNEQIQKIKNNNIPIIDLSTIEIKDLYKRYENKKLSDDDKIKIEEIKNKKADIIKVYNWQGFGFYNLYTTEYIVTDKDLKFETMFYIDKNKTTTNAKKSYDSYLKRHLDQITTKMIWFFCF